MVMLLRLSLSTACTSLALGDPLLRTGARVHLITTQANVKPATHATCCQLTLGVRRRCRCSCRNLVAVVRRR